MKVADVKKRRGGALMRIYKDSLVALLAAVFPEYDLKPFLFAHLPKNYFDNVETRREYVAWLAKTVAVESPSDLKAKDFQSHGGGGLLERYSFSPSKILESLASPKIDGSTHMSTKSLTSKSTPRNFWVLFLPSLFFPYRLSNLSLFRYFIV